MPGLGFLVSTVDNAAMMQRRRVDELWRSRDFRALVFLGVLGVLTLILAVAIRGILGPFILAGILAMMLNPAINAAERRRVPRLAAILALYGIIAAVLAAAVYFLAPIVTQEFSSLVAQGPAIASYFQDLADKDHVVSVLGMVTGMALWIVGVPYSLALGIVAGVTAFIPFIGPFLGALPAVAVAAFVSQSSGKVVVVLVLYFIISNVVYNFISPKVFGDAVHLSPMLIIIAFVVGGYLGGVLGLFVAVPVAATLRILFIYAHERVYA